MVTAIFNTMNINVISVDWCIGAQETYKDAFENIPSTAMEIVKFIDWLKGQGVRHSDLRLVGFSMGGQMSGFVARGVDQKLPFVMGTFIFKSLLYQMYVHIKIIIDTVTNCKLY